MTDTNGPRIEIWAIDRIKEHLAYDSATGELLRKVDGARGRWKAGTVVRGARNKGYQIVGVPGVGLLSAHRVAWLLQYGVWPEVDVDHINGIRDDNRAENLRLATRQENLRNMRIKPGTSNVKGVHWEATRGKWHAQIRDENGKQTFLGRYASLAEAEAVCTEARNRMHKDFARHR